MTDKILTLLGFASKAGNLSYGFDSVKTALNKQKSKLVLMAYDISPKTEKEVAFFSEKMNVPNLLLENCDMQTLSHAIGKKCAVLSVNDAQFANSLIKAVTSREELK